MQTKLTLRVKEELIAKAAAHPLGPAPSRCGFKERKTADG